MRSTEYCPERMSAVAEPAQTGHAAAGSGRTGADVGSGLGRTGMAVAGAAGEALAGLRGGAGVRGFQAGIEAGQCVLGNRAFMHWVGALQSEGQTLRKQGAPLQLMGKKKKQQQAVEVGAGTGEQAVGAEGGAGAGAEGTVVPGPDAAQPQASCTVPVEEPEAVEGAAGGGKKKKKKSRVQVALNTLRGEGMAAFGGYIEAEIGETELLRTLADRITRAEDLKSVRAEALAMVEARLRLLDSDERAGVPAAPAPGRQEPEAAVIAPVKTVFTPRERELFEACFKGDTGRFRRFLRPETVDINKGSKIGTLLCLAASLGHTKIVRELLPVPGIDVNLAQYQGATPLCLAAQQGYAEVVKLLLDKDGINVNLAAPSGATPLYVAAQNGHVEVVKLLLAAPGINVNPAALPENASPLVAAVQFGHEKVVKLLLAAPGIGIDMQKDDGATPLFIAAQGSCLGIVEQLVRRGADINLALHTGETPLGTAARRGNLEVVRFLLQVPGIQVEQANKNGTAPLGIASHRGHQDIVMLLLRRGANPNRVNKSGFTQLHSSCLYGNEAVVRMLVDAGADTTAEVKGPDGKTYTPYDLAQLAGHREVMSVLAAQRLRREAAPPRLEQWSITGEPGKTALPPASPEALSPPGAVAGKQEVRTSPAVRDSAVTGEPGAAGQATARVCPLPPTPSPPAEAAPVQEPPTPLAQAKHALRQAVLGKCRADNLDEHEGMELLMAVNATTGMDGLCVLYNRLAHIERREERALRRTRRRETLHVALHPEPAAADPAAAPVFALGGQTGLDAERVEVEIKRHLGQAYQRFVSQAVNDMEFGRGKRTAGQPGLWHVSAGIPGVGSCSVFYYLEGSGEKIRVVGIGHHVGRAAYRLDYAAEELAEAGRVLHIA